MLWRLLLKAWPVILNFIYSYILLCPERRLSGISVKESICRTAVNASIFLSFRLSGQLLGLLTWLMPLGVYETSGKTPLPGILS
jgi:hypothetical protein